MQGEDDLFEDAESRVEALRALAPFADAAAAPLKRLAEAAEWRRARAGQPFELAEDRTLACVEGRVRLIAGPRFFDVEAGGLVFLEDIVAGRSAPACAGAALTGSTFAAIPAAAIAEELKPGRALALSLARHFARRLAGRPADEAGHPARRLYAQLAMMAQPNGADGCWKIGKMPRHRELAALSGLSEEAAADAVAHLISTGVARRDYPGLAIIDYESLRRLSAA